MLELFLYVAAGLGVGLLIGLTGIGGGSVMTPVLVFGFGQSPAVAVGTNLVFSAATKLTATAALHRGRRIEWPIVARLAVTSVPAAGAVVAWLALVPRAPATLDRLIGQWLAVMLVVAGIGLLLQSPLQRLGVRATAAALGRADRLRPIVTALSGVVVGVAVALTSVGAGALGSIALLYLYPLRLTPQRLVATDIAYALPVTLLAALGHAALGHVSLVPLGALLAGSIPGVLLGTRPGLPVPRAVLRTAAAALLIGSAARLAAA